MAKILIVEDFSDARNVLGLLLASYGHEIIEAQDGQQAVDTASQQRPDLILMDMSMPVLSGWEATRRIKANPATADIPVIALTAHAMRGDRERAWEAGCDGFITKPIDDELLVHTIDQILSERQNGESETAIPPSDIALNEPGRAQEKVFTIHNGHVLIIAESGEVAGQFEASLKKQGYRTSLAEGLESALALIESDSPDLIVCGAGFDELSSYEIIKRIKQDDKLPFIPIILVTEDEQGMEKGLEAGADDFIARPADMTKLIARARSLIRLKMAVAAESSRADQLASVISQMFTGLLILDAEARVSIVNGSGLEMLCLSLDDVMGVSIDELVAKLHPVTPEGDAIDPMDFPLKRAIAKGESISKQIICVSTRNCDRLYLRCNAAPIYDERGRKIGAATVFEDVTEEVDTQKRLDEQKQKLEAANAQLRQLDYLKSRFLSNVAHEMRTPLTAIGMLTELLDRTKDQLPPEAQDVISRLMNNSHHINNMINDLLNYSRLMAGKEAIKSQLFSPKEMIEDARDSSIDVANERG